MSARGDEADGQGGDACFTSPSAAQAALERAGYIADRGLATAVVLAAEIGRPLLIEGEPGVGKTSLAAALSQAAGRQLIRLQCYEGLEATEALYEWDWAKQLLLSRGATESVPNLYGEAFLLERPLLRALRAGSRGLLLIDEIDRADEAFDAFLLEFLSDFSVTVPELGTVSAEQPPLVILTSNRTRELHDALTRRALYHWIEYPGLEREVEIIRLHAVEVSEELALSVAKAISTLRELDLVKRPGASEAIDWAKSLAVVAGPDSPLTADAAAQTLGAALKNREDLALARPLLEQLLE